MIELNPEIWGPHYWFFLHTIAINYSNNPNETLKKKYYELILNFALFIPNVEIANNYLKLIDIYPVTPYLDNRDSLMRWVHFIHNKINDKLGKQQISFQEGLEEYYKNYIPKENEKQAFKKYKKYLFQGTVASLFGLIIYLYYIYET